MRKMTIAAALKELKFQQASLSKLNNEIKRSITIEKDKEEPRILLQDFLDERNEILEAISSLKLAIIKANSDTLAKDDEDNEKSIQAWIIERGNIDELLGLYNGFLSESPGSESRGFGGNSIEKVYAPGITYGTLTEVHDELRRRRVEIDDLIQHTNYSTKIEVDI